MNTISTLLFFIAFPLALVCVLSVMMRNQFVSLLEALAIAIAVWAGCLYVVSTFHRWPVFTDQFIFYLFVVILPAAVTALTRRTVKSFWAWLLIATSISLVIWTLFFSAWLGITGSAGLIYFGFMPFIVGVIAAFAGAIWVAQSFDSAVLMSRDFVPPFWRPCLLAMFMTLTSVIGYTLTPPPLDFGITGTVTDASTSQPIEGAYVVAIYQRSDGPFDRCVMSRGMFTQANGKFDLPVSALNSKSPAYVAAIKAGYFAKSGNTRVKLMSGGEIERNPKLFFSDRNIVLTPQVTGKPEKLIQHRHEDGYCEGETSTGDITASLQFLMILDVESKSLGLKVDIAKKICSLQSPYQSDRSEYCKKLD